MTNMYSQHTHMHTYNKERKVTRNKLSTARLNACRYLPTTDTFLTLIHKIACSLSLRPIWPGDIIQRKESCKRTHTKWKFSLLDLTYIYRGGQKFPGRAAIGLHGIAAWELLTTSVHCCQQPINIQVSINFIICSTY